MVYSVISFMFFSVAIFYFQHNFLLNSSLSLIFFIGLSFYLFSKPFNNAHAPLITFLIDVNGYGEFYAFKNINEALNVQLLASSRVSFIGCWLDFQLKGENKQRSLFIYKDSLLKNDYSRLLNIIAQL